ncbi:MAG: hypothetical protein M1819_004202 [Sarea resinae]|nr:MAG: hypothetical protein M1819_004202 [Sarea resinae]
MSAPGPFSEIFGRLAYEFSIFQPFIPTYVHLIASALLPIYAGAHASLSRPSSAVSPEKRRKDNAADGFEDEDDGQLEEVHQKLEGFSPTDAITIPLFAGTTLAGLYFLIKWLQDPAMLNKILNWYFSTFGIFTVTRFVGDSLNVFTSFIFPDRWVDKERIWKARNGEKKVVAATAIGTSEDAADSPRSTPLPGFLSRTTLSPSISRLLWTVRSMVTEKWLLLVYVGILKEAIFFKQVFNLQDVTGFVIGLSAVAYYNLIQKPWFLTNLLGFGFSYGTLQLISPTTFWTGTLVLGALFFYDIYFVFYTPIMVTVAKSLDIPIKLLFPRPAAPGADPLIPSLAMLGLGDVVLPGIMIGLALRFDLYLFYLRKQTRQASSSNGSRDDIIKAKYKTAAGGWGERFWSGRFAAHLEGGSFPKTYFYASIIGYIVGMMTTIGVMQVFGHAQPALLYLVPGVVGSLWGTALVRGEIKEMWAFSEADDDSTSTHDKKPEIKQGKDDKVNASEPDAVQEAGTAVDDDKEQTLVKQDAAVQEPPKNEAGSFASRFLKERKAKSEIFYFTITAPRLFQALREDSDDQLKDAAGDVIENPSIGVSEGSDDSSPWRSTKLGEGPAWKRRRRE